MRHTSVKVREKSRHCKTSHWDPRNDSPFTNRGTYLLLLIVAPAMVNATQLVACLTEDVGS
jgi:hypothetical protein